MPKHNLKKTRTSDPSYASKFTALHQLQRFLCLPYYNKGFTFVLLRTQKMLSCHPTNLVRLQKHSLAPKL